jgi:hypothetical protein
VLNNADTMPAHAGWTELVSYSEGSRSQRVVYVSAPAAGTRACLLADDGYDLLVLHQ